MDHYLIPLLLILLFHHCPSVTSSAPVRPREGESVKIECKPSSTGTLVVWFRVRENNVEFIGSFSSNGIGKKNLMDLFSNTEGTPGSITLKSFTASRDIGFYSCGSLKNNQLYFGAVTSLIGDKIVKKPPPTVPSKIIPPPVTVAAARACTCPTPPKQVEGTSGSMLCEPLILGGLAGGCGLLLLLLIVITVYCNHTRTRRCPHHYRKRPKTKPPANK